MVKERIDTYSSEETTRERKTQGQIVRTLRESLNLTQTELAKLAHISQSIISQLENDHPDIRNPGYQTVVGLAKGLGQGLHFLEEIPEKRVFISPWAFHFQEVFENLPDDIKEALLDFVKKQTLQVSTQEIIYIDVERFLPKDELGGKIRRIRANLEFSQREVASKGNISQGFISQLELGNFKNPSFGALEKIAFGLKVDIEDLLEVKRISIPPHSALIGQFLRDPVVSPEVKKQFLRKLKTVISFLNDPTIQEHFMILPRYLEVAPTSTQ